MRSRITGEYTKCRVHGGASTGPKTPEGLARSRRAHWKHGFYSRQAKQLRRAERDNYRTRIETLHASIKKVLPSSDAD
jgi:hypothetical protein